MTTTLLSYIAVAIISGVLSTGVTIFSLYFLFKKHLLWNSKTEEIIAQDESSVAAPKNELSQTVSTVETISDTSVSHSPVHETSATLYNTLLEEPQKRHWKNFTSTLGLSYYLFFKHIYSVLDSIFSFVYKSIYVVLSPVLIPLLKVQNKLQSTFSSFYKKPLPKVRLSMPLKGYTNPFSFKSLSPIFGAMTLPTVPSLTLPQVSLKNIKVVETGLQKIGEAESLVHNNLKQNTPSKIVSDSLVTDIILSLVPAAFVVLPFLFKLPVKNQNAFFIYLFAVVLLGSFLLLYAKSSRAFWSIGISTWIALGYFFFSLKEFIDTTISVSTLFLSGFLFVYAASSMLWYGGATMRRKVIEYALYVLHALLYIAALYLLIFTVSPYVLGFVYLALAAFFSTIYTKTVQKRGDTYFANISMIVAIVALLSAIMVATGGLYQVVLLGIVYLFLYKKVGSSQPLYVLPPIIFLFLRTIESTNTAKVFTPILNERFIGYMVSAALCTHLYHSILHKKISFGVFSRFIKRVASLCALVLFFVGVTLEVLDVRLNTTLLPGKGAYIVLLVIYMGLALYLYLFGKKYTQKSFLVFSVVLSVYTLYFISNTLL